MINSLPGAPIVTVNGAADLIGRTYQATNQAIDRLVEAKILRQVNVGRSPHGVWTLDHAKP